jgi:hypothetical protein
LLNDANSVTFTGNDVDGAYAWGAQLEALPFASSYIRTDASAVSRSADNLSILSSPTLKEYDYTIDMDFDSKTITGSGYLCDFISSIGSVSSANRVQADINESRIRVRQFSAGSPTTSLSVSLTEPTSSAYNLQIAYKDNYASVYFDKSLNSGSNATTPATEINRLTIGSAFNSTAHLNGHISKFKTYAQAMTAQEITLL